MAVSKIQEIREPYESAVAEVCEALLANKGRFSSILFIAEDRRSKRPVTGIVGRFRNDPHSALGALVVLKDRLIEHARSMEEDETAP